MNRVLVLLACIFREFRSLCADFIRALNCLAQPKENKKMIANKRLLYTLMILIIASSMVLSSCSNQAKPTTKNQVAIYAVYDEPLTNWDPALEFSSGIRYVNNVYEQLLKYDFVNNKVLPLLATEWSTSDDDLTWTFKLRQGVKFHDGSDFNAEAVKFSIDRTVRLAGGASYIWAPLKEIKVIDDYTVDFILNFPAPLDLIAASPYAAFIYSPTSVGTDDKWFDAGREAGTGPYKLKSFVWGDELVIERYPDYWGGWQEKYISTVMFKKYAEPATRRELVESGDVQVTSELPYADIDALKANPNVVVNIIPTLQNFMPPFNTLKPPLDNKLVRQALSYAFPYDEVIDTALGGYGVKSYGFVPVGLWGHSEKVKQYNYDLEKAKDLLTQAGHPDGGFKLLYTYVSGDEAEKIIGELYKTELAKLGIELEIRSMPFDSQWALGKLPDPNERQDIFALYWWPDYASPFGFLYATFHTEEQVSFNLGYYYNPEFDKMIDDANSLTSSDRAKAEQLFVDAQNLLMEEAVSISAFDRQSVYVTSSNLKGYTMNPVYNTVVFFYGAYLEE